MKRTMRCIIIAIFCAALARTAFAEGFSITRHTIDGGGGYSAGDGFELTGTIGQPDAGAMAGDGFTLTGGFWSVASSCGCPGDMNGDGTRNGDDVQQFVTCMVGSGSCSCADVDNVVGVTFDDVAVFVADMLAGDNCP